jgi:hypothetical protein
VIDERQRTSLQGQFLATLDTVLDRSQREVERVAKLALLTSKHAVLSDTQLLDSHGLRGFLAKPSIRDFLRSPGFDGCTPIIACMRNPGGFTSTLESMLIEREKPMLFSSLPGHCNGGIVGAYGKERAKGLGHFFDHCKRAGVDFESHLKYLEEIFGPSGMSCLRWATFQAPYADLVAQSVNQRKHSFEAQIAKLQKDGAEPQFVERARWQLRLCGEIETQIQSEGVDRSALYRLIEASGAPLPAQTFVKREILDRPYNSNFARSNRLHQVTGDEDELVALEYGSPEIAARMKHLEGEIVGEVHAFPLRLEQITFAQIASIRDTEAFKTYASGVTAPAASTRLKHLKEYWTVLLGTAMRLPKAPQKARFFIREFRATGDLKTALERSGLSLADALAYAAKGGSVVIGELSGRAAGVPFAGGVVTWVLERATTHARLKRDFKHIITLLTAAEAEKGAEQNVQNSAD